jgi:SAM-dependent methyltransferase
MEIGAGIGNISEYFLSKNPFYISELDTTLLKTLNERYKDQPGIRVISYDVTKRPSQELIGAIETVFAVNVFEHIQDDLLALRQVYQLLKPQGKLLILVPAKQVAYTRLDKSLGHFRRYEKKDLEEKMLKAGFRIEKLYYFNTLGLLSWIIRDKFTKNNRELSARQIALFDKIVPLLRFIESQVSVPIGISLICVATKNAKN